MFDWEKEWHEGEAPADASGSWKELIREHPFEAALALLLMLGGLMLWGVS